MDPPSHPLQVLTYIEEAFARRVIWDGRDSSLTEAAQAVSQQLGLGDKELGLLPAEALKKLSMQKNPGVMPDLVHLNSPALQQLKLDLAAMSQAAEESDVFELAPAANAGAISAQGVVPLSGAAADAGRAGPMSAAAVGVDSASGAGVAAPGVEARRSLACSNPGVSSNRERTSEGVVDMVCNILRGNATLRTLAVKGLRAEAAEQLAAAVCDVSCGVQTLQLGNWLLPVGLLLGKQGCSGQLTDLDVSSSCRVCPSATAARSSCTNGSGPLLNAAGSTALRGQSRGGGGGFRQGGGVGGQQGKGQQLLGVEEALLLTGVLRRCSGLRCLNLGGTEHLPREVAKGLVEVVLQLPRLQRFNGMPLAPPAGTTEQRATPRTAAAAEERLQATGLDTTVAVAPCAAGVASKEVEIADCEPLVVDASSWVLGPVGAAVLGRSLAHMGSSTQCLRVLDLSGASSCIAQ
jgi:hypothetical protein